MRIIFTLIMVWQTIAGLGGQSTIPLNLEWQEDRGEQLRLRNEGHDSGNLPIVFRRIPIGPNDSIRVRVVVSEEKRYGDYQAPGRLSEVYSVVTRTESDRGQFYGVVYFYPIRSNSFGDVTVLLSGLLEIDIIPGRPRIQTRNNGFASQSVLSQGKILKIPILETDVYRINFEQLPTEWTSQNFSPDRIQIFAGHPGHLPYGVGDEKVDDLREVPYMTDGPMTSAGDGLIFYAKGSHVAVPSDEQGFMTVRHNVYADTNFYYVRYDAATGQRMAPPGELSAPPGQAVTTGSDVWR